MRQHVVDGHDVVVIASTESFGPDGALTHVQPGSYMGTDGARVIRLPYRRWIPGMLAPKLRLHPNVYRLLSAERPDAILFHGLCGWELLTVSRYKRAHPEVSLFADSHEDFNNSARSFLSRYLLHWAYYRTILHAALRSIDKVLCVSDETISFVQDFYRVPARNIEFFPLGGKVLQDHAYFAARAATRASYGILDHHVLLVQSGKMDASKKLLQSLKAFVRQPDPELRFLVVGHLQGDIAVEAKKLIDADRRIVFAGWKSAAELQSILCAADVYLQPGTQSATMQMSLCLRCAVILDDVPSHRRYVKENGWLIGGDRTLDAVLAEISQSPHQLTTMSAHSHAFASEYLDYQILAERITRAAPAFALHP
ncbi:glycosyltransferase family 4 protein [Hydrogenophaga sp.]|uniref:glycosyltransferase family 4 protein n=1 Tax=Hydrogenophaga sp. TaxID=1904254 RepID=UPI003D2B6ECB